MTLDLNTLIQRKAGFGDNLLLFKWKNDPEARQASFITEAIKLKNHNKWLISVINNPNILMYILEYESSPIGMYRLDITEDSATIDITVDSEYRGQGIGKQIIGQMILTAKNVGIKKLIAEVKKDNIPSNKLFLSSGFYKVKEDVKNGSPYSSYEFNVK